MYFTSAQKKALTAVLVLFLCALAYREVESRLFPPPSVDFSVFEAKFAARFDSLQQVLAGDSLVPVRETVAQNLPQPAEGHSAEPAAATTVNINNAGIDQLTTLPGIGPKIAARIIEYRTRTGKFQLPGDLMNVKGIGPKTYSKLQHRIVAQ